jgi:uncharacterized repeat protein (TIGR02543 family)
MPAYDLTLYAKWIINQYTISFDSNEGSAVPSITQDYATTTELTSSTKEGYTFAGWYIDEGLTTPYTFTTMPAYDLTLYAKWIINQYTIKYYTYDSLDNYDPVNDIPLYAGETITQVSLGWSHSSALTSEGRIFTWGNNDYGQLGDGTTTNRTTPTEITSQFNLHAGESIIQVSLGIFHSSAITSEGRIFTWGNNGYGQLGDGTTNNNRTTPTEITSQFNLPAGESIIIVSLSFDHSSALTSEGRIFTWGNNFYGQLGDGTTTNRTTPTEITSQFNLYAGETIIQVSLGYSDSSALTSQGRIFTWGINNSGQLGDGTTTNRTTPTEITSQFNLHAGESIIQASLGWGHSSALTSEGRIFTWGNNFYGQLGAGTTTNRNTPTEITSHFNIHTGETIIQVSLGIFHSSAITSEGRIFTWGYNGFGQLGDGTTTDRAIPTEITSQFNLHIGETIMQVLFKSYHSSALSSEGRILMWGNNGYGQLGDGTYYSRLTPVMVSFIYSYSSDTEIYDYNEPINGYLPTRDGYTFDGWYCVETNTTLYSFETMPAKDIILYGRWIPIE